MALRRYGDFRVEVFYFDSPCRVLTFDWQLLQQKLHFVHCII